MGQAITGSACRKWGARRFRKSLRDKGLGSRKKSGPEGVRRDTENFGKKGVSRTGFDRKEVERCSDTWNFEEKGVSRTGFDGNEGK